MMSTSIVCVSVCLLLIYGGNVGAANRNASNHNNTVPSTFGLIMKANRNQDVSRDGTELFQGDIIMTPDIRKELRELGIYPHQNASRRLTPPKRPKRAAMSYKNKRWMGSDRRPLVPYFIEGSNSHARRLIVSAMRHWTLHVPCLKFVRRTNHPSYLSFYAGGGCFSAVGRVGGRQRISIGRGCEHKSVIVHEIGHALGFWHEQSRPDRDRYVKIYWNNIIPRFRYAFHKYSNGRINSLGVPYDYDSVMHYNSKAFGRGKTTITRIDGDTRLGNRRGLSTLDIKQARLLYCGSGGTRPSPRPPRPTTRPPTGCSHTDQSKWCRYWHSKGFCQSSSPHYTYVSTKCKKTCLCKSPDCMDERANCAAWSGLGYCTKTYKAYMQAYCKKSCKICS